MTAPISLRDYFAAAGSGFTRDDAAIIGPQLVALAEDGPVDARTVVDVARSANSPLNRYFEWNDEKAADLYRVGQAGSMMKAIRVRTVEDGRPRVTAAYRLVPQPSTAKPQRTYNALHADSSFAAKMAVSAHDDLLAWRAKHQPYMGVWIDFAAAFRQVVNQIDECEELTNPKGIDHETDEAIEALVAWRARFGSVAAKWENIAEQSGFLVEAIGTAEDVFTRTLQATERACLRCSKPFLSAGVGNRMCEPCSSSRVAISASLR
jgi:hypothetical protein